MYRSKLQELCHKESWPLPEYIAAREGPDHAPRFTATVTVNGATFQTQPYECRSSKEANNQAAKLAYDHFTTSKAILQAHSLFAKSEFPQPSPGFSTSDAKLDMKPSINGILMPTKQETVGDFRAKQTSSNHEGSTRSSVNLYKSRLQNYTQKRDLTLPMYSCEINGPPHARRYKAKVTVSGITYEAPEFFSTLKDAEHAAAKVAFESLPSDEVEDDESLYKSLLQELAQKRGFRFPVYDTAKSGPPHTPIFVSTVEIGDGIFKGQEAKTKKQAEMSAAKVAYSNLIEGQGAKKDAAFPTSSDHVGCPQAISANSQTIVTRELQAQGLPKVTEVMEMDGRTKEDLIHDEQAEKNKGPDINTKRHKCSLPADSSPLPSESHNRSAMESQTTRAGRRKVLVRSFKPNVTYTDGPIHVSSDKWVAMNVDVNGND